MKKLEETHHRLQSEPGAMYSHPHFEGGSIESQFNNMEQFTSLS